MPFQTRYMFAADMDVEPDKEALFNEVYNQEHVPMLLEVPGVLSVARFETRELVLAIGGERRKIVVEGEPRFSAVYEIESPEVLISDSWSDAVDSGRWPSKVRPYTHNRRHVLRELTIQKP
jgi:hypothetical protein